MSVDTPVVPLADLPAEAQIAMMCGYLASELEEAIEGMEQMLPYVSEYFRNKWNLDSYIMRARAAQRSYQALKSQQTALQGSLSPSEAAVVTQVAPRCGHALRAKVGSKWVCKDCGTPITWLEPSD